MAEWCACPPQADKAGLVTPYELGLGRDTGGWGTSDPDNGVEFAGGKFGAAGSRTGEKNRAAGAFRWPLL
jgi:hypothetical protein